MAMLYGLIPMPKHVDSLGDDPRLSRSMTFLREAVWAEQQYIPILVYALVFAILATLLVAAMGGIL